MHAEGTGRLQTEAHLPGWMRVRALARYPAATPAETLILQRGENPTTDYYLRPRLEASGRPWRIADLRDPPDLAGDAPLAVVLCRYASGPWLQALAAARLTGVALFLDDDLAAMMLDPTLPLAYRAHVLGWHGRWTGRLSRVVSSIWTSTPVLARRYDAAAVLSPIPEVDPRAPDPAAPARVVYPGQALHRRERAFVLEVARLVSAVRPGARFEVVQGPGDRPASVEAVPERPWPDYRREQAERPAAIALAPLFQSAVNAARAPVKAFDAARIGAAGLFADTPPYRGFITDGVDGRLLPMSPAAWAEAIVTLLDEPQQRMSLASAAQARLTRLRRDPGMLPDMA